MLISAIGKIWKRYRSPQLTTCIDMDNSIETHLLMEGLVNQAMIDQARAVQQQSGRKIGPFLVDSGILSEEQLLHIYAQVMNIAVWDGRGDVSDNLSLSQDFLVGNSLLPIERRGSRLLVLPMNDDLGLVTMLRRLFPEWELRIYTENEIAFRLKNHFGISDTVSEDEQLNAGDLSHLKDMALDGTIIRQVNDLVMGGINMGASDIHLEPMRTGIELRYRVDGVLHQKPGPTSQDYLAVVSRLKILSNLDIAERRLPQDGRFRIKSGGRDVDIRISTIPSQHGEDITLRLLDKRRQLAGLDECGFSPDVTSSLKDVLHRSQGLILVTGPTGSGKTTALYAGLKEIINGRTKVITVEDPVEYEISGITQIQINAGIGVTFAASLRSILRHDPDIIFVGEIRDKETAEIAIQSSLTGHLVLSTLHTNSALGAINRLINIGIPDYLIATSLIALTGQRLVRRLCFHCRHSVTIDGVFSRRFNIGADQQIYEAVGCEECNGIGYTGRIPIAEIALIGSVMRDAIMTDASNEGLRRAAIQSGYRDMVQNGISLVIDGMTTIDEVLRVVS